MAPYNWVIVYAANPSVLAGVNKLARGRQLVEHNLSGTLQMPEACKHWGAAFVLLSTSRVYSIPPLADLQVRLSDRAFNPTAEGLSATARLSQGLRVRAATAAPVSLYGSTKLASEALALEYD